VLNGLIETIVDRMADFIERIQAEVDLLSLLIFEKKGAPPRDSAASTFC
jgi:Mg2+ and Co2+ transporter CorA